MSPRNRHLIIFAKAPRIGRVKNRLAADIGHVRAWNLYRHWLNALVRRIGRDRRWTTWLAVSPDTAVTGLPYPVPRARRFGQGNGDLGVRMTRAIVTRPPGPVVLIGADIPAVRAHHIEEAFRLLGAADTVFGPASDGGFWLLGSARKRPLSAFRGVRWSSAHALADSLAALAADRVSLAATLNDVDTAQDLSSTSQPETAKNTTPSHEYHT